MGRHRLCRYRYRYYRYRYDIDTFTAALFGLVTSHIVIAHKVVNDRDYIGRRRDGKLYETAGN